MNWDLTSFFPEFDGPEMKAFKAALEKDMRLACKKASALPPLSAKNAGEWEKIFLKAEEIVTRLAHLSSYVGCLSAADAHNEAYLREEASMALLWAACSKLEIEMLRAIKEASDKVFSPFIQRKGFDGIHYFLQRMRREARRTMLPNQEILATDLGVDGISAWGRLYDTISGKLEFDMEFPDGRKERLPISQRRTFLEDADRRIRRAAFLGGNAAWQTMENVAAAALNAISGTRLTLNRHRKIPKFLEVALFQSALSQKTLDAMFQAIYDNLELPKRYLRLKAKIMGLKAVAWYDLSAPLNLPGEDRFSWEKGASLIQDSFVRAYPLLGEFLKENVYDKKWVDWEPRSGKRPGGFCTSSRFNKESRIFMTYHGSMGDVRTLAHEAGHAFHFYIMRDLRTHAQHYPMTLAETASTFAEMILSEGILQDQNIGDNLKCFVLDQDLSNAAIYLMDIPVRYEFEKALYEERAKGELSVSRFRDLMIDTQRRIFQNTLEQGGEDPCFWASKLHFYITDVTFYNFPYSFGFLLSRGLYALFKEEGKSFLPKYEKFLACTGSDTCENVAKKSIGRDLSKPEFWTQAIRSLEEPLKQLESLVPRVFPDRKK